MVLFFDALGQATDIEDWPVDEGLFSAGMGIRWKTLIGPVRLEYAHNINRRENDPGFHFFLFGKMVMARTFPFHPL